MDHGSCRAPRTTRDYPRGTVTASQSGTRPSLSTVNVEECVRAAAERRDPLRIQGSGHWLDAGRPVRAAHTLALGGLTGVVDYTPGDLTLTALAGTTLAEIARVTAAERQWLALDPFGGTTGTIGATIATGSAGPLAHAFGAPRDNVLGLEVVTGDGRLVRTGGRVVKNVAGFDLTRLFTGSWGTLAVITEVTVRLRSLPEVEESWALPANEDTEVLDALLARLRFAPLEPAALELLSPSLAAHLGISTEGHSALLFRLGGNPESVRSQREFLAQLGDPIAPPSDVWRALGECEPAGAAVARFSGLVSRMAEIWTAARSAAGDDGGAFVHASVGRGIARCIVPASDAAALAHLLPAAASFDGTVIFERLDESAWAQVASPVAADRLSRSIKRGFDPMNVLNPGILGADT